MVAQLLTWQIYKYSIWTNILHQIFPSGFKGKKSSQVQQTNSTPDLSKLWKLVTRNCWNIWTIFWTIHFGFTQCLLEIWWTRFGFVGSSYANFWFNRAFTAAYFSSKVKNKILWFGLANGSIIADMADLQIFYMDQYLTSFLSIRF